MAKYVIGDIQGCYDDLMALISKIKFNPIKDTLIFCGDLVNRGGQSLQVLRWIKLNKNSCKVVLGNHDLSLLAQYYLPHLRSSANKELNQIFNASDCIELMQWLSKQKLLIHLKKQNKVIVHAGIFPGWDLKTAKKEALRIEKKLKNKPIKFLQNMYGSQPNHWSKNGLAPLKGIERSRFVVNSFTRMRYLYKNGGLNFKAKGEIEKFKGLIPWFKHKKRCSIKPQIIFGHWSALGLFYNKDVICLDTGKVWGGKLTALKLKKNIKIQKHIVQV